MPSPFLMNPVPAAVEILCAAKSSIEPAPTSKVTTVPFVANVPAAVSVTFEEFVTLIPPTLVPVTYVINELAVNPATSSETQPDVNGPAAVVPQFAAVQVFDVPFVFQNLVVAAFGADTPEIVAPEPVANPETLNKLTSEVW
jgi:hypothetical protein